MYITSKTDGHISFVSSSLQIAPFYTETNKYAGHFTRTTISVRVTTTRHFRRLNAAREYVTLYTRVYRRGCPVTVENPKWKQQKRFTINVF